MSTIGDYFAANEPAPGARTDVRALIVGALFDFGASLTTGERLTAGSGEDAAPMVERLQQFMQKRNIDIPAGGGDVPVTQWREILKDYERG
jgi:hypothetical protein